MRYVVLADVTVLVHVLFVLFVVFGGIAVLHWQRLIRLHLPALVWGVIIELAGWVCPLTYLENYFRRMGGASGYGGTFIEQYLEPLLYPLGLTQESRIVLALLAVLVNAAVYLRVWRRYRRIGF